MRPLIFGLAGIVVLGLLFFILQPSQVPPIPQSTTKTKPTEIVSKLKTFDYVIEDRRVIRGDLTLTVNQGDEVMINVMIDVSDELHLHGYDIKLPLTTTSSGQIKFTADKSGRFPIELHRTEVEIGAVEVLPR